MRNCDPLTTLSGTIYLGVYSVGVHSLGVYSVRVYNSRATDFGSGQAHTHSLESKYIALQHALFGEAIVWGSTSLGRWVLNLDTHVCTHSVENYRGFNMRCLGNHIEHPSTCIVQGSLQYGSLLCGVYSAGVYSVAVYNSRAMDFGSGHTHTRALGTVQRTLQHTFLGKTIYRTLQHALSEEVYSAGVSILGRWILDLEAHTCVATVWESTAWGSTIFGRRILDLAAHIPIIQKIYRGPFNMRCLWKLNLFD